MKYMLELIIFKDANALRIIILGLARLWKLKPTKSKNISSNTMNMSRFSLWSPGCWRKSSYTTRRGGAFSRCHQGVLGVGGGAVLNLESLLDWLHGHFFGWLIHALIGVEHWTVSWCVFLLTLYWETGQSWETNWLRSTLIEEMLGRRSGPWDDRTLGAGGVKVCAFLCETYWETSGASFAKWELILPDPKVEKWMGLDSAVPCMYWK